jgi:hypothetical protein
MPDGHSHFEERLTYGDDCPVCGDSVKAWVRTRECGGCGRRDGPTVYNSECVQHKQGGPSRYIFHE